MKKLLISMLFMTAPVCTFAQLKVLHNGKVTIQSTDTICPAKLVVGDGLSGMNSSSAKIGIFTSSLMSSSKPTIGLIGEVTSLASGKSGQSYGVLGRACGTSTGYGFGVCGQTTGTGKGAGVYGIIGTSIYPVNGKYAGFFCGETHVEGLLSCEKLVNVSDARLKTNIESLSDGSGVLDNVLNMNVVTYNFKARHDSEEGAEETSTATTAIDEASDELHYGLLAQELQEIYPDLVYEGQDGYLGINYVELVPILIRSIQELKEELDEMKGSGTVRRSPTQTSATSMTETKTRGNILYQNTPNPFKEQTVIRFQLADNVQNAAIHIFDMTGKMLKKLPISSGMESVTINGYELGEGLYLYSLVVNGQEIDTKKMIISK